MFNLPLRQQLKRHFGHKKCWSWTLQGKSHTSCLLAAKQLEWNLDEIIYNKQNVSAHRGIADGSEAIKYSQSSEGINELQRAAKNLMEYVTDPSTPTTARDKVNCDTDLVCLFLSDNIQKLKRQHQDIYNH